MISFTPGQGLSLYMDGKEMSLDYHLGKLLLCNASLLQHNHSSRKMDEAIGGPWRIYLAVVLKAWVTEDDVLRALAQLAADSESGDEDEEEDTTPLPLHWSAEDKAKVEEHKALCEERSVMMKKFLQVEEHEALCEHHSHNMKTFLQVASIESALQCLHELAVVFVLLF